MDGSGGKAYPTEEQRRIVEKDAVRSSYRHEALRRTRSRGWGSTPRCSVVLRRLARR
jgi:hypothetical protein